MNILSFKLDATTTRKSSSRLSIVLILINERCGARQRLLLSRSDRMRGISIQLNREHVGTLVDECTGGDSASWFDARNRQPAAINVFSWLSSVKLVFLRRANILVSSFYCVYAVY